MGDAHAPAAPRHGRDKASDGREEGSEFGGWGHLDPSPEVRPSTAFAPPPPDASSPPAGISDDYAAWCCRETAEHAAHWQSAGSGFVGPPHYFGDNGDAAWKIKNQAELLLRAAGYCFKCRTVTDEVPFRVRLSPLHRDAA
jgi:hypothetical protein